MALSPGTRLGVYEILAPLGKGGMGEVYRARDTRLNRDVAIKVLPASFAGDPDRLARFEREARVLASLNHPNIAHVHGLEESGGVRALVMELVEGEDLSQRIAGGPVPIDDALGIARQIAEALEAAHEQGIVHRDLKPANIKVKADGTVKVLDFGLARALDPAPASDVEAMDSPTITSPAMTMRGMILGTAAYMSPEQARGKPVDRRADIWAFGVVLYETLTGRRAFEGVEVSDVLAAVLRADPDWTRLPADTPAPLRTLLRRCLQKDAKNRLADAADARLEIDDALASPAASPSTPAPSASRRWVAATSLLALVVLVLSAFVVYDRWPGQLTTSPPRPAAVVTITFPGLREVDSVAISPDGRRIAVAGHRESRTPARLVVRELNQFGFREIPDTDGARQPFFSPDGQWIAFFTSRELKKVSVEGGLPIVLAAFTETGPRSDSLGGSWGTDETILFSTGAGISRVGAAGGPAVAVTTAGAEWHASPQHLPGGARFLFARRVLSAAPAAGFEPPEASDLEIAVQDPSGTPPRLVIKGASEAVYSPTRHLLFDLSGSLFAMPFDARSLTTGPAAPIAEGLRTLGETGASRRVAGGAFSVSSVNSLVFVPPADAAALRELVWVDRAGRAQPIGAPPRPFLLPRLSPSGTRVAVTSQGDEYQSAWVYDLERNTFGRLSVDPPGQYPLWSPDGTRIAFENSGSGAAFFLRSADGSGTVVPVDAPGASPALQSWSGDGRSLLYQVDGAPTDRDLWTVSLEGARTAAPLVATRFFEGGGTLSPDGKLVAWVSQETGADQVYVQTYPAGTGRVQVSVDGGLEPVWSRSSKELFYRLEDKMLSVSVATAPSLIVGKPTLLFEGRFERWSGARPNYDVSPDGQRFLMLRAVETPSTEARVVYIADWPQLLVDKQPVTLPGSKPQ